MTIVTTDGARQELQADDPSRQEDASAHLASLREIYDSIPLALCIIDRDLRFTSVNRRMLELTRRATGYYVGRAVTEVVPNAMQLERQLRLALAGERINDSEAADALIDDPDDGCGLYVSLGPLYHNGSIAGIVCAATERRIREGLDRAYMPGRLLIAEDLQMNQMIISEMLESAGHTVISVEDGAAAVNLLRRESFDLVLMDIEMPVMGGIQAAHSIRGLERIGSIPIVAMTANNLPEQVAKCRAAGMDAYLSKPVNRADLLAVVERLLKTGRRPPAQQPDRQHATIDAHLIDSLESRFGTDKMRSFARIVREQIDLTFLFLPNCTDREQLGDVLHALVSLAGHIGLRDVSARSRALMAAVRNGSDDMAVLTQEFRVSADEALSMLDARYPDATKAA